VGERRKERRKEGREEGKIGERSPDVSWWGKDFIPVGDSKGSGIRAKQGLPRWMLRSENKTLQAEAGGTPGPPRWGTGKGSSRARGCPSVSPPGGGCSALGGLFAEQGLWLMANSPFSWAACATRSFFF